MTAIDQVPLASSGTEAMTDPRESEAVRILVVEPFFTLTVTLPLAGARPDGVATVTLYLPAFLVVGFTVNAPLTLLTRVLPALPRTKEPDAFPPPELALEVEPAPLELEPEVEPGDELALPSEFEFELALDDEVEPELVDV